MPRNHGGHGRSCGGARGGRGRPTRNSDDDRPEVDESSGRVPIPSFRSDDFPSWKFEMQSYLLAQKCWIAIEGDQERWEALSLEEKEEKSAKAFNFIRHALRQEYQYIAREYSPTEPVDLWSRLEE